MPEKKNDDCSNDLGNKMHETLNTRGPAGAHLLEQETVQVSILILFKSRPHFLKLHQLPFGWWALLLRLRLKIATKPQYIYR